MHFSYILSLAAASLLAIPYSHAHGAGTHDGDVQHCPTEGTYYIKDTSLGLYSVMKRGSQLAYNRFVSSKQANPSKYKFYKNEHYDICQLVTADTDTSAEYYTQAVVNAPISPPSNPSDYHYWVLMTNASVTTNGTNLSRAVPIGCAVDHKLTLSCSFEVNGTTWNILRTNDDYGYMELATLETQPAKRDFNNIPQNFTMVPVTD